MARTPVGRPLAGTNAAVLAAVLLAPSTALALQQETPRPDTARAESDTAVFVVEGIRVQANRPFATSEGASAIEVTVDSLGLTAAPTTEELLRKVPVTHLRTNSRGEAEITIRGSESRQVAVLLDGVPLTLGWDGRTDVSVLPAGAVTDVNLVRGLSSLLHGPNVLGGVVEMKAGQGRLPLRGSVLATAAIDDRAGYGASVIGERPFDTDGGGQGVFRVGIGYRDSPGFPLPRGVSEPVPTDRNLRLNTDADNLSGFAAVRFVGRGGAWGGVSASSFKAERGIAAELGAEDPRLWRYPDITRTIVATSAGTGHRSTPWGMGDLEASVGLDLGHSRIEAFDSRAYDQVVGTEEGDDRTVSFRLVGDHTLGDRGDARASFTYADIFHEAIVDGESADYQQRLLSIAAESVWRLLARPAGPFETVRMSFGGAYDRGTTPKTGGLESLGTLHDWGARLGLSALTNRGRTLAHLSVSRRGRFPSLRETYSEALNRFVPNPDLHPEHLLSFEAGATSRLGAGELQAVVFHNRLSGAIRRITLEDGRRQRINSDELRSTGLEVLFSQTFGSVGVGGDLTLQAVNLMDPGTSVSTEPENVPEQVGRVYVSVPVGAGFDVRGEVEYTGSQFCQDPNTGADVKLDAGTWLNVGLSKVWTLSSISSTRSLETSVSGSNLADTALYDQCGLPRAGRLFRFQIRLF